MTRCSRNLALALGLLLGGAGCKDDTPYEPPTETGDGDGDAGAASTEEGATVPLGASCLAPYSHCEDGECRNYTDYALTTPGQSGFCSRVCSAEAECASGFRCTQTIKEKLCLPRCSEHSECDRFSPGWKCAEAQGERICANPATRGGEIVLRTQLVIDTVTFGTADQAWRFVPGLWADVSVVLKNKGSSGPVKGTDMAVMSSDSEWVEVGTADRQKGSWQVRTLPGVPIGEPQQLKFRVPDPVGTGSIDVPFFIRSLASGLQLKPAIGVVQGATNVVDVAGSVSGFGTAPALINKHGADDSPPWAMLADPWLAEARPYMAMGVINAANVFTANLLGVTVSEPTGSSWEGPIYVVPEITHIFEPAPVRRSALAGGKTAMSGFRVRDPAQLQQGTTTTITMKSDQPWAVLVSDTAGAWNGETFVYVAVTEPPDPVCSRAWITLSWNTKEFARVPIVVSPDVPR